MFLDDISVENLSFAVILRSPAAKGRLKAIHCPALAEGFLLITAKDIPGASSLFGGRLPLLAGGAISYCGEPVALLCGPDLLKLEEYAAASVIEVAEETPVFSIEEAWDAGAFFGSKTLEVGNQPKTVGELVVEGHYETGIQEHWYSEAHGAIVSLSDERVLVTTAAQRPNDVRGAVAAALGIEEARVVVENADLGIHLDGKIWYPCVIAALAALAAFISKKAVKIQLTREEDYLYSPKRTPSVIHLRSLLTFDGQILATDALAKIGFGAAGIFVDEILDELIRSLTTGYKTGRLTVEALAIKTNVPPAGPFAGFGASLAAFAMERHISKICDVLGEEGSEWRTAHLRAKLRERFFDDGEGGVPFDIFNSVAKESGFKRKWAAYELLRGSVQRELERILPQRGIGVAFALSGGGMDSESGSLFPRQSAPAAACVIEIEIDRVNYESKIRGVWLHIACGRPPAAAKAELTLRRAVFAALGWASTEKIKLADGKIVPSLCALYQLLPLSKTPPVHISFAYENGSPPCEPAQLEELPFDTVPAAYTQAISQAIDYHLERIPITGQDVWRVITIKKFESTKKEKPAATGEGESGAAVETGKPAETAAPAPAE